MSMTDWKQYLHAIRKSEIETILKMLPKKHFSSGLECGAGDTYQTTLLAPHFDAYISSDLNSARFDPSLILPHVTYMQVDADAIAHMFQEKQFDVIFSSNMLEHVADPIRFLHATRPFLKDDGYAIHVVPSRGIKISYILLYYPYLIRLVYRKIRDHKKGNQLFGGHAHSHENNINVKTDTQKTQSRFRRFLFPSIHGNFPTHRAEYYSYGKNVWQQMFQDAGYWVMGYQKGPAFSGYGFGCSRIRTVLQWLGFSSEHIFVLQKKDLKNTH